MHNIQEAGSSYKTFHHQDPLTENPEAHKVKPEMTVWNNKGIQFDTGSR